MFFADALGALWRPLRVVIFLSPHPGASRWSPFVSRNILKRNGFWHVFARGVRNDVMRDIIASAGKCHKVMKKV